MTTVRTAPHRRSLACTVVPSSSPSSSAISFTPIHSSKTPPTSFSHGQAQQLHREEREDDPQHDGADRAPDHAPRALPRRAGCGTRAR